MSSAWDTPVRFDAELMRKYDTAGPRYTSYPTAVQFNEQFGEAQYRSEAQATNGDPIPRALSLYFHIPFCATVCYYCACNKVITANQESCACRHVSHPPRSRSGASGGIIRSRPSSRSTTLGGRDTHLSQPRADA